MTRPKPIPWEMPLQIASTTPAADTVSVTREESRRSSSSPRRWAWNAAAS